MHFQAYVAILTGLCSLTAASPLGWFRGTYPDSPRIGASRNIDKREAYYGGYGPRPVFVTSSRPIVTSVHTVTSVPVVTSVPIATEFPSLTVVPEKRAIATQFPSLESLPRPLIDATPGRRPPGKETHKHVAPRPGTFPSVLLGANSQPVPILGFDGDRTPLIGGGPRKRAISNTTDDTENTTDDTKDTADDTEDTTDVEVPLRKTWVNYIKVFIYKLNGEKCPGNALIQPPPSDDELGKRSAELVKRQPKNFEELFKLFVSVYNKCPEQGYR